MHSFSDLQISESEHSWLRLRTFVMLRSWAIVGQFAALLVGLKVFDLHLNYALCLAAIGLLVISNLVALIAYPANKRLTERQTFLVVLLDMVQLAVLLYLTGGLHNPFSILIIGPVVASAPALSLRSRGTLGVIAIIIVTVLFNHYQPLATGDGYSLLMPDVFLFGNYAAIVVTIIFLGGYVSRVISEMQMMSNALQATQLALLREQKLTDLGRLAAATAHELGTPLATIKLTSSELVNELKDPDLREDAQLITEQTDRCRDILRSMGNAIKDDPQIAAVPISAVIEEAATPHVDRKIPVLFEYQAMDGSDIPQPVIPRAPGIIHGIRNLIQNAVDFAESTVWVETLWSEGSLTVRIADDGQGYPPHLLGVIGDPYIRSRNGRENTHREGYEGMGLGLFIAKTLLERSGASVSFSNGIPPGEFKPDYAERIGAFISVTWTLSGRNTMNPDQAV